MGISFRVKTGNKSYNMSYSTFRDLKERVAYCININYQEMEGTRTRHPKDENYFKMGWQSWDKVKSPLKRFLMTKDIDSWTLADCKKMMPLLDSLLLLWEDDNLPMGIDSKSLLAEIANVVHEAIKVKQPVEIG